MLEINTGKMKTVVKSALLIGLLMFGMGAFAQSLTEAGDAFNQGTAQYKAKHFAQAVQSYEKALKMCKAIGPDAADLQSQVETQLGNSYFWDGIMLYKNRQFDQALNVLKKAKAFATQTNNAKIKNYAHIYIARVLSSKGLSLIKAKKYSDAAAQFALALKEKPDCYNAYYGKVLLAKKTNDMSAMMAATDHLAQMAATNAKAGKRYNQAKYVTFTTLLNAGAEQLQKMNAAKALVYLNDAKKYGAANADLYYYTAVADLNLKKYDSAIAAAKKAVSMQTSEKSDIYFILGQAYQKKGEKTAACTAFKHVVKGPNVKAAQYQIKQVLKCK
jgi:tetratricopeptide (TPR) repeat protein